MENRQYVCKRDGQPMYLVEETEKLSTGEYRVTFSYKCMVCGYSVSNEYLIIKRSENGEIVVSRKVRKSA